MLSSLPVPLLRADRLSDHDIQLDVPLAVPLKVHRPFILDEWVTRFYSSFSVCGT